MFLKMKSIMDSPKKMKRTHNSAPFHIFVMPLCVGQFVGSVQLGFTLISLDHGSEADQNTTGYALLDEGVGREAVFYVPVFSHLRDKVGSNGINKSDVPF
jgi:hypothetical protein